MKTKNQNKRWDDRNYVKVYTLAKSGLRKAAIAKILRVTIVTFYKWLKQKPALKEAYVEGRKSRKGVETFRTYVYNRLPDKLKTIWNRINALEQKKNGVARVESILKDAGKGARQHLFLYAYTTCGFNASEACRCVNIDRQTYEGWYKNDPEFHALFDEMEFHKKNYFEGALVDLVSERDVSATIFVNKTYNADRGYGAKLKVEHTGSIEHNVQSLPIEDLGLTMDLKKALLKALREKQDLLEQSQNANRKALITG